MQGKALLRHSSGLCLVSAWSLTSLAETGQTCQSLNLSWRRSRNCTANTAVQFSVVLWDIAIDAEYNRITSIVENSIDEENNVDGGFSNLETHKNSYHLPCSAMYLVWLDNGARCSPTINPTFKAIKSVNIFLFIHIWADWDSRWGGILWPG